MNETTPTATGSSARFRLDWFAGATAVIDVAPLPDPNKKGQYTMRYGSPFRPTMRAPAQSIAAGLEEFDVIAADLQGVASLPSTVARGRSALGAGASPDAAFAKLVLIGKELTRLILPRYMMDDLIRQDAFVEIGTDERLVHIPWELLHDGEDFFSLRHSVGRYVNLHQAPQGIAGASPVADLGELRVLLVAVPNPLPQQGIEFDPLPGAEAEADSVMATMADLGIRTDLVKGPDATFSELRRLLIDKSYHIIHFTGHASFSPEDPTRSALILHDRPIRAAALTAIFGGQRGCVLSFINACETTQTGEGVPEDDEIEASTGIDWDREYDIFGLARSFLESGSYLLGSRWLLPDKPAATFATTFYRSLLADGAPIGTAIRDARLACVTEDPMDVSWASYIYYGDPRICFKRLVEQRAEAGGHPAPAVPPSSGPASIVPPRDDEAHVETSPSPVKTDLEPLRAYARKYEEIPQSEDAGPIQTAAMTRIVYEVSGAIGNTDPSDAIGTLLAGTPGERIVAMALLQERPDPKHLVTIMDAIETIQTPFEQYQALVVAMAMVPRLTLEQSESLRHLLRKKLAKEGFFGSDRALLARNVLAALNQATLSTGDIATGNPTFS